MSSVNEEFVLPNTQPVVALQCETAFKELTKKEKLYTHYLSQACWIGSLIILLQTSPESPVVFTLLHKVFSGESVEELKKKTSSKLTDDELKAVLVYACGLFANMGNYKGMGDSKFIPNLPIEKLELFIKESEAYKNSPSEVDILWQMCKNTIYSLNENVKCLGFPGKGITTYFSSNYSTDDVECITNFMKQCNIEGYNNRAIKYESALDGKTHYQILLASIEEGILKTERCGDTVFEIKKGDYSPLLVFVNENLQKAKEYASTDNEKKMLDKYIESFKTGSLDEHKNGSRFWIKNKNPIIETYIGFIETYRDPQGSRGEFEGFVAIVNKEMSKKFATLVNEAESILLKLPWPNTFEKDKFQKPDFTSLDVLTFAGSGIPCGINIPNYDDIRQNEGFKNVSLGNVIPCGFQNSPLPFLSSHDKELVIKYAVQAFEVQVGLHELLGHGSGKLFHRSKDGEFDFDINSVINPLTGQPISSWYEPGDTYDSIFNTLGSTYEECRAECVGLYLSLFPEIVKIFVDNEADIENITYVNWLLLLVSGVEKALEMYQPNTKSWLQAHAQARFVITNVLLEAGDDLITVTEPVANEKLLITLNKEKLRTTGLNVIKDFLLKLQVYKSIASKTEAQKLFDKYSEVSDSGRHPWLRWRSIVLKHKQPRKIFVQPNTIVENGDDVKLKTYEPSLENVISSWVERFPNKEQVYSSLLLLAEKDREHFKY